MEPTLPFEKPLNNPPKAMDEVSKEVHAAHAPSLARQRMRVLKALSVYIARHSEFPTSAELLEWMQRFEPQLTVNQVRPRLTELVKADLARKAGRRACKSKSAREQGSKVAPNTFAVTQRGRLVLKETK